MSEDEVFLVRDESRILRWVASKRLENALQYARNPGLSPAPLGPRNALGVHGEFGTAIILNVSWRPNIGEIGKPDIGKWPAPVEVRTTDLPYGCLPVKPSDKDDRPYVLCIGDMGRLHFHAVGWLYGHEAKQFPIRTDRGDPAHYVKQGLLSPLATLRSLIRPETQIVPYRGEQLELLGVLQ